MSCKEDGEGVEALPIGDRVLLKADRFVGSSNQLNQVLGRAPHLKEDQA